jgi:glucoamylase
MRLRGVGVLLGLALMPAASAHAAPAPGGPGALSHFDLARKDCVGTAANRTSKVWFTVAGGMLSDVYSPTVDNTNVETMQYLVTDGSTFTDLQSRDMTYTVRSLGDTGMACEVTARNRDYRIVTRYVTDPARDAVVMRVRFVGTGGERLYVRLDPSVNGNGGGGPANGGADDAAASASALTATDTNTVTNAANRDYAVPTSLALRANRPFAVASAGFAGTDSDGLAQLDAHHALTPTYDAASQGNVVDTAGIALRHGRATLALGFGRTAASAESVAGTAAGNAFDDTYASYQRGWDRYDAGLRTPPKQFAGLRKTQAAALDAAYRLSVNVVKASEDKTFPGAIVAGLASPWGQAVSAGDAPGGKAVYFGSYREVFSRDLYEADTGLLTAGDVATVRNSATPCSTGRRLRTRAATSSTSRRIRSCSPTRPASRATTRCGRRSARRRTSSSPTARRSGRSAGRSRAASRRRRSRRRSPASSPRRASPMCTATPRPPASTARPPTTSSARSRTGR